MMDAFHRSLRRSADGIIPKMDAKQKTKSRTLSVVDEVDDHTGHQNTNFAQRSRLESETEGRKLVKDINVKAPNKALKKTSFLKPIPQYEKYTEKFDPPLSPVPLPEGVVNIDDVTDSCTVYAADIIKYARMKENEFRVVTIKGEHLRSYIDARNKVVSWMQALLHYIKCSFETTFHAISILDRTLAKKLVKCDDLQLIAITATLIATKMEEYYTADIVDLIKCTDDSYTQREVLSAEKQILRILDFKLYGHEPTLFIDRFIAAAFRQGDKIFRELVMFMMDALTIDFCQWSHPTSLKAAAAVYTSLFLPVSLNSGFRRFDDDTVWTPTLVYNTTYLEADLLELATYMLDTLIICLEMKNDSNANEGSRRYRLKTKYSSVSRHHNLLGQPGISVDNATFALACVDSRKAKLLQSKTQKLDLNEAKSIDANTLNPEREEPVNSRSAQVESGCDKMAEKSESAGINENYSTIIKKV